MRGARCSATWARKALALAARRSAPAPARRRPATRRWPGSAAPAPSRVPAGRVGAAEAVQQLLRLRQRQVVGADLDVEQDHVDVVEEVQVDVHDLQRDRRVAGPRHDAHRGDVAAAEHPHRRVGGRVAAAALRRALRRTGSAARTAGSSRTRCSGARWKPPAAAGVFVDDLAPRRGVAHVAQQLPRRRCTSSPATPRHQAQRPQQGLPQVAHLAPPGCVQLHRRNQFLQHASV